MLLFIAAEKREYAGLAPRLHQSRPLPWAVEYAVTGGLNGEPAVLIANGAGPRRAAAALAAVPREPIRAVISTGLCGALDPDLRLGDIFCATEVRSEGGSVPTSLPSAARPFASGPLLSTDRVASSAAEKAELRQKSGARTVEMEASGLAVTMRQWGIPWYCVRAVSDEAHEGFALDLNAARLPDGRFSTPRILGQAFSDIAVSRSFAGIRELRRLARQSAFAAQALGEFLVDCRF